MSGSRENAIFYALLLLGATACSDDDKPGKTNTADSAVEVIPDSGGGSDAGAAGDDAGQVEPIAKDVALPIVFVHGFAGSAAQYESQFMRFVANGYPAERIIAYDHDGAGFNTASFVTGVTEVVDKALADFGVEKVYLVGHSRGTVVSSMYLRDPARAAKVAKYISLDGGGCADADTAGVPCIAPSQENLPGQKHVEVATSKECFVEQFKFLIGEPPAVSEIVKQDAPVEISGRAVNFPANIGRDGDTLQIWEINAETGARATDAPLRSFTLAADGNWGPVTVNPDKYYELLLFTEGAPIQQHFYPQRFLRSDKFVRLLSGPPDSPARVNANSGPNHAAIVALRMREWMTIDVLEISTSSVAGNQAAFNAVTSETADDSIGFYVHDDKATPAASTGALLPYFSEPGQAFQTGSDVFMPAADPPNGTITVKNLPRGDASKPQILNVPNWASDNHTIMLMFSDFPQD